jgi:RNA polymerase sigma-54 factor
MLHQGLSQKQMQKLSPQQIHLLNLLKVPTAALEQRIKEEMEINPALDEGESDLPGDEFASQEEENESIDEYKVEEFLHDYMEDEFSEGPSTGHQYANQEEEQKVIPIAVATTLYEHLGKQIELLDLDEEEEVIVQQIIGSIDEDGYLRRDKHSIMDDLLFGNNLIIELEVVERMIAKVQKLDPPGIGARDLRECLLLQLEMKIASSEVKGYAKYCLVLARKIVEEYFEEFSRKHYSKMLKSLDIEEEVLKDAIDEIVKLNPKPASAYQDDRDIPTHYVIPDFIVINREGELELILNSKNAPDLHVSDHYRGMLKHYKASRKEGKLTAKEREAALFIKQKIESAKWFIDAIKKRQNTLFNTMYTIMQFQKEYFLTGDDRKLKPLILQDISDITGLDVSTTSRVVKNKYVQTEYGTKLLKDFFSESVQNVEGEDVSTTEVKSVLEDIIKNEDKKKPLSDQRLQDILEEKGFSLARRTITKYREKLNIPVARLRKEI